MNATYPFICLATFDKAFEIRVYYTIGFRPIPEGQHVNVYTYKCTFFCNTNEQKGLKKIKIYIFLCGH